MIDQAISPNEVVAASRQRSPRLAGLRRALAFHRTQIGLAIVLMLVLIAVFGPVLAPKSPTAFVASPYAPPSKEALFGTDYIGRDVLSRFLYGGRSVLGLALASTALGVFPGVAMGLMAAYSRPSVDNGVMRSMDVLMAFPPVIFALLIVSTVGTEIWLLVVAVAIIHLPRVARLARGAALEVVERDFVKSAEALGERRSRIILGEILPNITGPLLVEASLRLTFSIALVASLSFLGFGLQPPAADWGLMISENRNGLSVQPWGVVLPVAAIALLTVGTSLIADGLSRALVGIGGRDNVDA